jgi:hypothetical protein
MFTERRKKMKKKWKIVLASFLLLAIGGAGTVYYSFTTKEYDISQDKKVEQIVETEYNVALPDSTNENAQNNGNDSTSTSTTNEIKTTSNTNASFNNNTVTKNETKSETSTPTNTNNQNKQTDQQDKTSNSEVTAASIVEKYRPSFINLQQQANAKIDALVAHAFAEYQAKKSNNEEISFTYFYRKYNTAAKELEVKTDAAFETIYQALEAELTKHGFSTSHAQEFRDAYEQEKAARRNALIQKTIGKL